MAHAAPLPDPTLSRTFALTDTIEFEGFTINKPVGRDWKHAKATLYGAELTMDRRTKQIFALLISQQGEPLFANDLRAEFSSYTRMDGDSLKNNYKQHIYRIKEAIRGCLTLAEEQRDSALNRLSSTNSAARNLPTSTIKAQETGYLIKKECAAEPSASGLE